MTGADHAEVRPSFAHSRWRVATNKLLAAAKATKAFKLTGKPKATSFPPGPSKRSEVDDDVGFTEATIHRKGNAPLGVHVNKDTLRLEKVDKPSLAEEASLELHIGQLITHVNGRRILAISDISPAVHSDPTKVVFRFQRQTATDKQLCAIQEYMESMVESGRAIASAKAKGKDIRNQVNPDFYTPEALLKRKKIRESAAFQEAVDQLWNVLPKTARGIDKATYMSVFFDLVTDSNAPLVQDEGDKLLATILPSIPKLEAARLLDRDWAYDSQGISWVDKRTFTDSVFDLIDTWSNDISQEKYVAITKAISRRFTASPVKPAPVGEWMFGVPSEKGGGEPEWKRCRQAMAAHLENAFTNDARERVPLNGFHVDGIGTCDNALVDYLAMELVVGKKRFQLKRNVRWEIPFDHNFAKATKASNQRFQINQGIDPVREGGDESQVSSLARSQTIRKVRDKRKVGSTPNTPLPSPLLTAESPPLLAAKEPPSPSPSPSRPSSQSSPTRKPERGNSGRAPNATTPRSMSQSQVSDSCSDDGSQRSVKGRMKKSSKRPLSDTESSLASPTSPLLPDPSEVDPAVLETLQDDVIKLCNQGELVTLPVSEAGKHRMFLPYIVRYHETGMPINITRDPEHFGKVAQYVRYGKAPSIPAGEKARELVDEWMHWQLPATALVPETVVSLAEVRVASRGKTHEINATTALHYPLTYVGRYVLQRLACQSHVFAPSLVVDLPKGGEDIVPLVVQFFREGCVKLPGDEAGQLAAARKLWMLHGIPFSVMEGAVPDMKLPAAESLVPEYSRSLSMRRKRRPTRLSPIQLQAQSSSACPTCGSTSKYCSKTGLPHPKCDLCKCPFVRICRVTGEPHHQATTLTSPIRTRKASEQGCANEPLPASLHPWASRDLSKASSHYSSSSLICPIPDSRRSSTQTVDTSIDSPRFLAVSTPRFETPRHSPLEEGHPNNDSGSTGDLTLPSLCPSKPCPQSDQSEDPEQLPSSPRAAVERPSPDSSSPRSQKTLEDCLPRCISLGRLHKPRATESADQPRRSGSRARRRSKTATTARKASVFVSDTPLAETYAHPSDLCNESNPKPQPLSATNNERSTSMRKRASRRLSKSPGRQSTKRIDKGQLLKDLMDSTADTRSSFVLSRLPKMSC